MSTSPDTPTPEESPHTEVLPTADPADAPEAATEQLEAATTQLEGATEQLEALAEAEELSAPTETEETTELTATEPLAVEPEAAVVDWRTVETTTDSPVGVTTEPVTESTAGSTTETNAQTDPGAADHPTGTNGTGDSAASGSSTPPPPVWTAPNAADLGRAPAEPPARGVRVGQLIWSCVVIIIGIFLMALALIDRVNVPILLISLVAVLGLGLIVAAAITSRKKS